MKGTFFSAITGAIRQRGCNGADLNPNVHVSLSNLPCLAMICMLQTMPLALLTPSSRDEVATLFLLSETIKRSMRHAQAAGLLEQRALHQ